MKNITNIILITVLIVLPLSSIAESAQRVGRYTLVKAGPDTSEVQPLSAIKKLMFPLHIQNVYVALQHILKESGYTLDVAEEDEALLTSLSLPNVHRELGPISIISALRTLVGSVWEISVDRKLRQIKIYDTTLNDLQSDTLEANQSADNFQQPIAVHHSEIMLKDLIAEIIPAGWEVSYKIPHDKTTQVISFHAESTKRKALEQLFASLHLEGVFYPLHKILLVKNVRKD